MSLNDLTIALLRAAGIPIDDAISVTYRHTVNEIPT